MVISTDNMRQLAGQIDALVGDTPAKDIANPFHLQLENNFRLWLAQEGVSIALTTYEGAKLILIGPGMRGGTIVAERNFERCMAVAVESDRHIWVSTHHNIWKLENGLQPNRQLDGWDRVYMPRTAHVTGGVDIHDLVSTGHGPLLGVVTLYNCVAHIGEGYHGSFSPFWRPPFISEIIGEDRCHLNGFCMDKGQPAYASIVGVSNERDGWRAHRNDGGVIVDMRTDKIVVTGLSMPHTPRLHKGKLYFLEAGRGWFCSVDPDSGKIVRLIWRPGFLRGLRFYKNYAFLCCSKPRDETFKGLPLDKELEDRGQEARCSLDIVNMDNMSVVHSIEITGSVKEIYDVAILPGCRQPLLYGVEGADIKKIVVLGEDETSLGPLSERGKKGA